MKLTLRHPSGLEVTFEGDEQDYDRLRSLLDDLPQIVDKAATANGDGAGGEGEKQERHGPLDVRALDAQLQKVGAKSDIERVTVMAQQAVEAGSEGIEYGTAEQLFENLGLAKPQKIRATFQNAKSRGFVQRVGRGLWRPTIAGENFAKLGAKGRRGSRASAKPEPEEES